MGRTRRAVSDALLSQVLMASTYPTNVAQAVQWSHDNPLKQGDAAIQAVSDQPWDASVKSLVAFPQLMALMGENPQWVQNLGDAFLAQPQDVMDSVQRLRQLAQQTGSLKSSTEQKVITTTKKAVPVKQTVTAPVIPSNTVLTANPVITEPATTVISIEPANPDVVYIPNYNPTVVYGNWANTAYPPVYLPPPAGEPFVDSFVRGFAIAWALLPRTHYSAASTGTTTIMTIIIMTMMIIITTMAVIVTVMAGNTTATTSISTSTISTVSPVSILLIRIWHGGTNPNYRNGVPYHDQDMAKRFHQTDVNGGMSATQLPAPTRDSQRQAAANQFQQRTHAAPVITRDTQRQAAAQRFNEAEHYGSYDDFHDFSRRQPLTQQQKDAARQRYQSASPEQRQAVRERMQTNPQIQQRREQRVSAFSPPRLSSARRFARKCRLTRRTSSEETQRVSVFSPHHQSSARCLRKKYSSAH
ncbi:Protein of uncharacterised function (DUF3300) [Escherichia coli]|uniref:Protein of uncharacterized function (DUF3300) n=1 Tax=Escherichia coli TaxID=562 RepID=A0A377E3Q1_ECOLX|nr:Protein of uncharacterised function (DUF3300) [Escherichia coli]